MMKDTEEKGYTKYEKKPDTSSVTLELKSKALQQRGQVRLSAEETLQYRDGKIVTTKNLAQQLLRENNDFEEVK